MKNFKKNCKTCGLYINGKCYGRDDIYEKEIEKPIENCEEWEISFEILQDIENPIDAIVEKILGEK